MYVLFTPISGVASPPLVGVTISVVEGSCPCSVVGLFVGPIGEVVMGIFPLETIGVTASVVVPALLPGVPGSFVGTIIAGLVLPSFPAVVDPLSVTCPHVSGPDPQGTGMRELLVPEPLSGVVSFPFSVVVPSTLLGVVPEPLSEVAPLGPVTPESGVVSEPPDPDPLSGVVPLPLPAVVDPEPFPLSVTDGSEVVIFSFDVTFPFTSVTGSTVVMFMSTGASVVMVPDPLSGVVELLSVSFPDIPDPLSVVAGLLVVVSLPPTEDSVVLGTSSVVLSVLLLGASVVTTACVVGSTVVGFSSGFDVTQWHS